MVSLRTSVLVCHRFEVAAGGGLNLSRWAVVCVGCTLTDTTLPSSSHSLFSSSLRYEVSTLVMFFLLIFSDLARHSSLLLSERLPWVSTAVNLHCDCAHIDVLLCDLCVTFCHSFFSPPLIKQESFAVFARPMAHASETVLPRQVLPGKVWLILEYRPKWIFKYD